MRTSHVWTVGITQTRRGSSKSRLLIAGVASIAFAVAVLAAHPVPLSAQATTITANERVPIGPPRNTQPNPCVTPTDVVTLNGYLHIVTHTATTPGGGVTLRRHVNPQDVTGVGAPSGITYRSNGATNTITHMSASGAGENTFVNNFHLISQGPAGNLLVHIVSHQTVNANGQVTSDIEKISIECR